MLVKFYINAMVFPSQHVFSIKIPQTSKLNINCTHKVILHYITHKIIKKYFSVDLLLRLL